MHGLPTDDYMTKMDLVDSYPKMFIKHKHIKERGKTVHNKYNKVSKMERE